MTDRTRERLSLTIIVDGMVAPKPHVIESVLKEGLTAKGWTGVDIVLVDSR